MGPGRFGRRSPRLNVEDVLTLGVGRLVRLGVFARDARSRGALKWHAPLHGVSRIGFAADASPGGLALLALHYLERDATVTERLTCSSTPQGFGGVRWWIHCP
jgi:hypothetical protein